MEYAPYSASKFEKFKECRKKFYYQYVEKIKIDGPEPGFFERGHYFHYILQYFPNYPPKSFEFEVADNYDISQYRNDLKKVLTDPKISSILNKTETIREEKFIIGPTWEADKKILRFPLVLGYIDYIDYGTEGDASIIDWKTGRVYKDKSEDQLKLYALWLFLFSLRFRFNHGLINKITCSYYYIEHDTEISHIYYRNEVSDLIDYFKNLINIIENETEFPKSKTVRCHYCDYFEICAPFNIDWKRRNNSGNNKMVSKRT